MPDQIDLSKMQSVPVKNSDGHVRLHRYWKHPVSDMWDEIWEGVSANEYWESALEGKLNKDYERIFQKYLSEGAKVLEAGCGVGQVVLAMRARGFDCHGLDFAEKVIDLLNVEFPEVPFHKGDIRNLPFQEESFDGYISLGVIEHFVNGQDKMLAEAARIIKSGSYAFVSVPALNAFRKLKIKTGGYRKASNLPFFESCFSLEELQKLLRLSGFEYVEHYYSNPVMSFVQETPIRPFYRIIEDLRYVRGAVDRLLNFFLPTSWFGHMIMVVAKKK